MARAVDGHGYFTTPDGLDIWVTLGIAFGGDGPPRVEIASIHDPSDMIPINAIDRAGKLLLFQIQRELRKRAGHARPVLADPKPKDRRRRARV